MNLEELRTFFLKEEYQAEIEEKTEVSPRQLVVLFGDDLYLRVTVLEEEPLQFMQFFLLFPFQVKEEAVYETARLILSINAGFDLASFGMMEGTRLLYYRQTHAFEGRCSEHVIKALVDSIHLLLEAFQPSLEAVSQGKKSIAQLQVETKEKILAQEFEII